MCILHSPLGRSYLNTHAPWFWKEILLQNHYVFNVLECLVIDKLSSYVYHTQFKFLKQKKANVAWCIRGTRSIVTLKVCTYLLIRHVIISVIYLYNYKTYHFDIYDLQMSSLKAVWCELPVKLRFLSRSVAKALVVLFCFT